MTDLVFGHGDHQVIVKPRLDHDLEHRRSQDEGSSLAVAVRHVFGPDTSDDDEHENTSVDHEPENSRRHKEGSSLSVVANYVFRSGIAENDDSPAASPTAGREASVLSAFSAAAQEAGLTSEENADDFRLSPFDAAGKESHLTDLTKPLCVGDEYVNPDNDNICPPTAECRNGCCVRCTTCQQGQTKADPVRYIN